MFDNDTVGNGLETGLFATGSAATFGIWNGGSHRCDPGFATSAMLAGVGRDALTTAIGMGWAAKAAEAGELANSVRIASSAGGRSAPGVVERIVQGGDNAEDLINEMKVGTFQTGNEFALVRLASGEDALVSGGPGGIDFEEGQITYLYAHTHPTIAGPSAADFDALRQLGQESSWVYHGGEATQIFANAGE